MPPVEQNTIPSAAAAVFPDLKVVDKATKIPIVNDTILQLEKVRSTINETAVFLTVKPFVEEGMTSVSNSIKAFQDNERVHALVENETLNASVSTMRASLMGSVEKLDNMACNGIDSLTQAIPALTSPTPELMTISAEAATGYITNTREAARGYLNQATEVAANFTPAKMSRSIMARSATLTGMISNIVRIGDLELVAHAYARLAVLRATLTSFGPRAMLEDSLLVEQALGYINTLLTTLGVNPSPDAAQPNNQAGAVNGKNDDPEVVVHAKNKTAAQPAKAPKPSVVEINNGSTGQMSSKGTNKITIKTYQGENMQEKDSKNKSVKKTWKATDVM